jgi:hypothetical protein
MQMDSRSATETAQLNLALMEERLNDLNAALDRVRSQESIPRGPETVEDDRTAAIEPPSHTAEPGAPEGVLRQLGALGGVHARLTAHHCREL